jgi:hypothetical protein
MKNLNRKKNYVVNCITLCNSLGFFTDNNENEEKIFLRNIENIIKKRLPSDTPEFELYIRKGKIKINFLNKKP